MLYRVLADLTLALHLAYIVFVVAGGFLAWRWRWVIFLHVPAAIWGALVQLMRWTCPLTPLEVRWRRAAGQAGYEGGFVEHYLVSIIYPAQMTWVHHVALGAFVVVVTAVAWGGLGYRIKRERSEVRNE